MDQPLTGKQLEALKLIASGKPIKQIAHELDVSRSTVEKRLKSACKCLDAANLTEAVLKAYENGYRLRD